jgi:uncharacterized protein (TIGR04255 family)
MEEYESEPAVSCSDANSWIFEGIPVARLVPDDTNFGDRAPATEALIDVRIEGVIDQQALESLSGEFAAEYPEEQPLIEWIGKFEIGAPQPLLEHGGVRGFLRRNAVNQSVVQFRRDGFTFSKLKPYTSWQDVSAMARPLWARYVEIARPEAIVRMAVRYINHIRPPVGWASSIEWLSIRTVSPQIPGIDSQPSDFFIRILQKHPSAEYVATITVATIAEAENQRALLLDIDAAHSARLPPDDPSLWSILNDLRDYKNDIFFGTITQKTRELLHVANS